MRLSLLPLLVPALLVRGHGPDPDDVALYRRTNLLERDAIQKRCGATLYGIHKRRLARRGAQGPARRAEPSPAALCSMTPELTEGPYHVNNELFRQNVTDGEPGVPLTLHVTFMDVATCEVAPNLWMEIWAANTTGFYSGFTAASLAAGQGGGGPPPGGSMPGGPAPPTGTGSSSGAAATTSLSPLSGADSATDDGSPVRGNNATDQLTFLRGVTQADGQGEATMYTIVPGWYTGRAVHIHIRVFNGSSVADNGTFISSSGTAHHTGQLFFKQELLDDIAKLPPYTLNPVAYENSTTNEQDGIYPYAGIGGYDPDLETELLGDDLAGGLEGHIVITINGSYVSPEVATAYYTGDGEGASNETGSDGSTGGSGTSAARRRWSLMGFY
ncbi:aromatic compound dioxygenase [Auricularia subglabra TFB-10046 SS5]|uniref:Aromatic compound dioxygenase n=1 Tax=Auricularia subglabra (strain TFB-10046 / SS5) TaxID=717982 RepID=J0WSG8_AURST|nr:aromatic compound dioxygenase [Auricularia subglabra TFB-10046 SS5]